MHSIEVDFEVYKQLTVRRATEDVSYNDVIRELLGLDKVKPSSATVASTSTSQDWVIKGVRIPGGTEFRSNYKGQIYPAHIEVGALVCNGKRYDSPSAAAVAVTGSPVNGWRFWECRLPGKSSWQLLDSLRR